MKLHLGCGLNTPDGWINIDGSWNAWLSKYPILKNILKSLHLISQEKAEIPWSSNIISHDVRKPLPFKDNYFSAIYTSHLIEHLYLEEAKTLLNECFRVLGQNGVLRVIVPDLKAIIHEYIKDESQLSDQELEISRADKFNNKLLFRYSNPPAGNIVFKIIFCLNDYHLHKWMYDADSLTILFKRAGFSDVKEMQPNQSRIKDIDKIENPERILNGAGFCIEGVKLYN